MNTVLHLKVLKFFRNKSPEYMKNMLQIMHLEPHWQIKWPIYVYEHIFFYYLICHVLHTRHLGTCQLSSINSNLFLLQIFTICRKSCRFLATKTVFNSSWKEEEEKM